jgi:hypothetical protein
MFHLKAEYMTKSLGWLPLLSQVAFLVLIASICLPVEYRTLAGAGVPQVKAEVVLTTPVKKSPTGQVARDEASAILPKTHWDWQRETRTGVRSTSLPQDRETEVEPDGERI